VQVKYTHLEERIICAFRISSITAYINVSHECQGC